MAEEERRWWKNTKDEAAVLPNVYLLHAYVCLQILGSTGSNYTLNFNKNSFILLLKFPLLFEKLKGHVPKKYCLVFFTYFQKCKTTAIHWYR